MCIRDSPGVPQAVRPEPGGLDPGHRAPGPVPAKQVSLLVQRLCGVPSGAAGHDGSELLDGPGEHFTAFLLSALQSSELLRWLVEVDSDARLPVLAEMYVWDDVVVLDHC